MDNYALDKRFEDQVEQCWQELAELRNAGGPSLPESQASGLSTSSNSISGDSGSFDWEALQSS